MRRRLELHDILCALLGSRNVYFQPPESVKLKYPCIVYSRRNVDTNFADNKVYKKYKCYELTVITTDPDSDLIDKILELPLCKHDRHFTSDNLNHDTYTIFY